MQISGTTKEIRFILDRAITRRAEYIYFVPPNTVWLQHDRTDKGYTLMNSTLMITHPFIINEIGYTNLRKFMKRIWTKKNKEFKSSFQKMLMDYMTVKENSITFDYTDDFSFEIETKFLPIDMTSAFTDRLGRFGLSSVTFDTPYLKINRSLVADISYCIKKVSSTSAAKSMFYADRDARRNTLRLSDDYTYLWIDRDPSYERDKNGDEIIKFEFDSGFFITTEFQDHRFYLSDLDIHFMSKMIKMWPVDNFYIIPFKDFYLLEAHGENMIMKVHHKYK